MNDLEFGQPSSEEMDDNNLNQLKDDERSDKDLAEPEGEPPDEELPDEPSFEMEDDEPSEPPEDKGESAEERRKREEIEWLKAHDKFKPGLIESFEDLAKSHTHAEKYISSTRRLDKVEAEQRQQLDDTEIIRSIADDFVSEDPSRKVQAVVKIVNAMRSGDRSELLNMRKDNFRAQNPDEFAILEDEIDRNVKMGLGFDDAVDLAFGRKRRELIDLYQTKGRQNAERRESQRQQAMREKSGGVRAAPANVEQQLIAVQRALDSGKLSPDQARDKMDQILSRAGS